MKTASSPPKSEVFYEVLEYLFANTRAQDTVEGIVEWWLMIQRIKQQTAKVRSALDELVTRGLVHERLGQDGRKHYRVNRRKASEIRRLLSERSE